MNDQPTHRLPGPPLILTINGGSSSIKFALFEPGDPPRPVRTGQIERIGQPKTRFTVKDAPPRNIAAPDHTAAVKVLMDWLEESTDRGSLDTVLEAKVLCEQWRRRCGTGRAGPRT
jgi:acetate kinase